MKESLKNELCAYLGQLTYEHENESDWIQKDKLIEKINAINILLDTPHHMQTWYEKITKQIKSIH